MSITDPETERNRPCPSCGSRGVFIAVARPGQREMPLYPVCCECGRERDDLVEFYADPPTQPR